MANTCKVLLLSICLAFTFAKHSSYSSNSNKPESLSENYSNINREMHERQRLRATNELETRTYVANILSGGQIDTAFA